MYKEYTELLELQKVHFAEIAEEFKLSLEYDKINWLKINEKYDKERVTICLKS